MTAKNYLLSFSFVFIQFLCLIVIFLSGPLMARQPVLLVLETLGLILGVWAILVMRIGHFNIAPDLLRGSTLVTSGPYRFIRHPMYSSLLLVSLAVVLDAFTVPRGIVWLILLVNMLLKLRYEENMLRGQLEGYDAYRQQSKRLIPFLF